MKTCFDKVEERFDKIDERFDKADERFDKAEARATWRFDSLHHTILRIGGGLVGTMAIGLLGLIATRI